MVSYTRAKSESLGFTPGTGMANVGVAPREVRLVLLTLGLLLSGAAGGVFHRLRHPLLRSILVGGGTPWLAATLALITVLAPSPPSSASSTSPARPRRNRSAQPPQEEIST